jgi:hypothetical protein
MPARYDVSQIKKCPVYRIDSNDNTSVKYIMFGPDLSSFKQFTDINSLFAYASEKNFILDFKNDS